MNDYRDSIRVLHVLGPLRPSGMERMLTSAAGYFRDQNCISIVLGQGNDHPFANELRSSGYDVRIVNSVASSWNDVRTLRQLARDLAVDVIHIHTEGNYLRTAIACRIALGCRGGLIRTVHSVFAAEGIWRLKRLTQALIADRLLSSLIVPSPDVALNEIKFGRRARVIFNWVDDRFFAIREARAEVVKALDCAPLALLVGNCSDIKHHELALRALESSGHTLIHLGDERGASNEELALLQGLDHDERLLGRGVDSPDEALRIADYFMMPSRHEGMGVALAEALVAGVPAVVNDVPGLRWARGIDGVCMLPNDEHAWTSGLVSWRREGSSGAAPTIDFSAARGAQEYADAYRVANRRISHAVTNLFRRASRAVEIN